MEYTENRIFVPKSFALLYVMQGEGQRLRRRTASGICSAWWGPSSLLFVVLRAESL
nr:MAG TPA: hypothetical protein [Caudoviricetes sp.]